MKRLVPTLLLLTLLATACNPLPETDHRQLSPVESLDPKAAKLSCFLNIKDKAGPPVWIQIASLEILTEGRWLPLLPEPLEIDAPLTGNGQKFISRTNLPPGRYERLRVTLQKAAVHYQGKMALLLLKEPVKELKFPEPLDLAAQDSRSLFIIWDTDKSLPGTAVMDQVMSIAPFTPPLRTALAYAACPEIDTIYTIRTDSNRVVDSMAVSGRPSHIKADRDNNRLYVLAPEEQAVKVIELSSNKLIDLIAIPKIRHPDFMLVIPEKRRAYVFDRNDYYLACLDLNSGTLANYVQLEDRPVFLTYLPELKQLALSTSIRRDLQMFDADKLTPTGVLNTSSAPQGIVYYKNFLYITESQENSVKVYDPASGQTVKDINVGFSPQRLLAIENTIYVTNYDSATVSLISPDLLVVTREIQTGAGPLEMLYAAEQKWLYIGTEGDQGLAVINITSGQPSPSIFFGAVPQGLDLIR